MTQKYAHLNFDDFIQEFEDNYNLKALNELEIYRNLVPFLRQKFKECKTHQFDAGKCTCVYDECRCIFKDDKGMCNC